MTNVVNVVFLSFLKSITIIFFCCVSYVIFAPIIFLLLVYRILVIFVSKNVRPDLDSVVSGMDAAFLMERPEDAKYACIMTCFVVRKEITSHRICQMFQDRVLNLKNSKGFLVYERLFQYYTLFMGYAFWKADTNFMVENHVRQYDYDRINLQTPSDEKSLKLILPKLINLPWKENRSRWEVLVIAPYQHNEDSTTGKQHTLIIFRFDHVMLDGLSTAELFRVLFKSPFSLPKPVRNREKLSKWQNSKLIFCFPYIALKVFSKMWKGGKLGKLTICDNFIGTYSARIPVSVVKNIGKLHEVDFSAVIHSALSAGVCHALNEMDKAIPDVIDVFSMLPFPNHPGGMSNYMRPFFEFYPLKSTLSIDRLQQTNNILKNIGNDLSSFGTFYMFQIVGYLPAVICRNFICSIITLGPSLYVQFMPTTSSAEFIDEGKVVDMYYLTSPPHAIGMTVAAWGFNNQQRLFFLASPNVFGTDAIERFITGFEEDLVKQKNPRTRKL